MSEVLTIGEISRRSGVAASALRFYEEQGPDHLRAGGDGPPPLPAAGPAPDRVHRLRAADRADARGDRQRAREAPPASRADPQRLVPALQHVDGADRPADRRARAPPGRADRVHRVRLSLARALPALQSRRPGSPQRPRAPLLGRRPAGLSRRRRRSRPEDRLRRDASSLETRRDGGATAALDRQDDAALTRVQRDVRPGLIGDAPVARVAADDHDPDRCPALKT